MKKKYIVYLIILIIIVAGSYFVFWGNSDKETKYVLAEIQRGKAASQHLALRPEFLSA